MSVMNFKLFFKLILISAIGLSAHIVLQNYIPNKVNHLMEGMTVLKQPYPWNVNLFAFVTAILPVTAMAIIYFFINPYLLTQSRIVKGLLFGLLMLVAQGRLIREPLMNWLIGNSFHTTVLLQISSCIPQLIICILIAIVMPLREQYKYIGSFKR